MTKTEIKSLLKKCVILPDNNEEIRRILLRHGKFFPCQADIHDCPIASDWKRQSRPQPKRCFFNAQKFAKENLDLDISYWEGVVFSPTLSSFFCHAWNTVGDDLIDLTLTRKEDNGKSYLGVKIDRFFLFDHEQGRWEGQEVGGFYGGFLLEYFKDDRYKEYPLPGTEVRLNSCTHPRTETRRLA